MWQDNLNTKKGDKEEQIIDKYNKEISNTRIVVSEIMRKTKGDCSIKSNNESKSVRVYENCCSLI